MKRATITDKDQVVDILSSSFQDNKSVNYIILQDRDRSRRIRSLMEYSFDVCHRFGDIFLSDDHKACALIVLPDKKKTTLSSVLLDVKLIFFATGIGNAVRAMKREAEIKKNHPQGLLYYLWFIGVDPKEQGKGIGSALLQEVIANGLSENRTICLETSTLKNISWYEKFGFSTYQELDFGYKLFCMKRE